MSGSCTINTLQLAPQSLIPTRGGVVIPVKAETGPHTSHPLPDLGFGMHANKCGSPSSNIYTHQTPQQKPHTIHSLILPHNFSR
ncbi:hypothetical protein QVD17_02137 [Tagetes erecta]|uniref:Uncharacterized protein n=1 Tax=Tagetes erecta TaxID=13708 RepID=A0AAD8LB27_TARER|nr:hypothetical protein QVD17_02137 [Tagetes erecta]